MLRLSEVYVIKGFGTSVSSVKVLSHNKMEVAQLKQVINQVIKIESSMRTWN